MNQITATPQAQLQEQLKQPEIQKVSKEKPEDVQDFTNVRADSVVSVGAKALELVQQPKFRVETYASVEITSELVQEVTDFYRYIFANAFGTYMVYPSIGEPITPQEVFHTTEYVSLEDLDTFDINKYPPHPQTGEKAVFWMDPEITFNSLRKKLFSNAHLALLRDNKNEIAGFIFGRQTTIEEQFNTEEWKDPYVYSTYKNETMFRDFSYFLKQINLTIDVHPGVFSHFLRQNQSLSRDTPVYAWNTVAIKPEARKQGKTLDMMRSFFEMIPVEMKSNLINVAEVMRESKAHKIFQVAGFLDVPGLWEKGKEDGYGSVIIVANVSELAKSFSLSAEDFRQLGERREKMNSESLDYIPHHQDNPKVRPDIIEGKGRGVFAFENISQGEIIAVFEGEIHNADKLSHLGDTHLIDHVIQVGETEYLYHEKALSQLINHSCDPNCKVQHGVKPNTIEIIACREIIKGEEIVWDYETSEDSDWCMTNCQCGAASCRGTIRAYPYLPEEKKKQYQKKDMILGWLIKKYGYC